MWAGKNTDVRVPVPTAVFTDYAAVIIVQFRLRDFVKVEHMSAAITAYQFHVSGPLIA
jgi:hypothetical protein